jgi:hypothetical protein
MKRSTLVKKFEAMKHLTVHCIASLLKQFHGIFMPSFAQSSTLHLRKPERATPSAHIKQGILTRLVLKVQ